MGSLLRNMEITSLKTRVSLLEGAMRRRNKTPKKHKPSAPQSAESIANEIMRNARRMKKYKVVAPRGHEIQAVYEQNGWRPMKEKP